MRLRVLADMFIAVLALLPATPMLWAAPQSVEADGAPPAAAASAPAAEAETEADAIPAAPDPRNAATWYAEAHRKYRAVKLSNEQEDALSRFEGDPSRGATTEVRQLLKRQQTAMTYLRRAARRDFCNFQTSLGEDKSPLSETYLQRLSEARTLARPLRYDYYLRVFEKDVPGAIDCLSVWYRMAGHFAGDNTLTASMVSMAMLALADGEVKFALDHGIIGPGEAAVLLREIGRFDPDDPARFRDAARSEMLDRVEPLLASFRGEGGVERFRAFWHDFAFARDADETARQALEDLTREELDPMLARLSDAIRRAVAALDEPEPEKALAAAQRVRSEIDEGRFGPFALNLVGYWPKSLENMQRARKMLADRRATLEAIAAGELDPMSLANAAVWCIRATMQMENIDPTKIAAVDAYAGKHDQAPDAALAAIFIRHDVQSVIDTLRTAAHLKRCDFAYANWRSRLTFSRYHAGLLACGRLLVADAARLFHEQRYTESVERLAIAYRLSAHLATDGKVAGSLAAHRVFADADALADAIIDSHVLDTSHIAMLAEAVRTISRVDPFHYQPAIADMRRSFDYTMTYFVQGLPKDPHQAVKKEERERADLILAGMSPDRFLSFAIVYEYWEDAYYRGAWGGQGDPGLDAAGLDAIFDMNALRACADVAPFLTEWSRGGLMENVLTGPPEFPLIAPLEERSQQSLEDYRRCLLRFNRLLPKGEGGGALQGSQGIESNE